MGKIQTITFTMLTTLLLMSSLILASADVTVPTFTLSSSIIQIPYLLPAGTTFNGSISTTGTVRFWANAPNGTQTVNLGLIDETAKFSFVAKETGNYTLNFENDLPTSVQVTFSYATDPEISSGNPTGTPLNYSIALIVVTVVGSILIIYFVRRKNKNRDVAYDTAPAQPLGKITQFLLGSLRQLPF
jgi:hypothetical protein